MSEESNNEKKKVRKIYKRKPRSKRYKGGIYVYASTSNNLVPRYDSKLEYDFLKYIRIMYRWAKYNSDLSRREVDTLLYLYGSRLFLKTDFYKFYKTISFYGQYVFKSLLERGWIVQYRHKKKGLTSLYTVSIKGKKFCNKLHKICMGEIDPSKTFADVNKDEEELRMNNYYIEIMKKMTKDKLE